MKTSDFYYELPEELIAQFPSDERDKCRLMVLNRDFDREAHIDLTLKNPSHIYEVGKEDGEHHSVFRIYSCQYWSKGNDC